jgi:hypothetical protein
METKYTAVDCLFAGPDPGKPLPGIMYVFKDELGVPQMVEFLCPCGCGRLCPTHVISIEEKQSNINEWKNKCWGFDEKTLTISPSIRYLSGCKAHFSITNGKVEFYGDSGK